MAKISVLGAGSWGTALSLLLYNNGHSVRLWSALKDEVEMLNTKREHESKLPGVRLPEDIEITWDLESCLKDPDVAVLAVPSPFTRSTSAQMAPYVKKGQIIVNVAKGVEENTLMTLSEIISQEIPQADVAVLSGPSHAEEVGKKLAAEMKWYDNYLAEGEVDRSANPTPGNKKGGLANIVEKAMGSIAKSGTSPIVEVLSPAEKPSKKGLIYAATPASDIVCGPCQLASGIGLQVFMTGRGTPYGLAIAPVIKVCSRNEMKEQWPDLIDINAGPVATGEATIADIGTQLFMEIIDVASGRKKSFAEKYKLHNDLCIFNPAPIT